mmetsp:Transcript_12424/g.20187  ORF Transcript_12424/g.20187 Transcript_12424/m.20187 type:complete len:84 (-) Transcript_12424:4268-4519(-)
MTASVGSPKTSLLLRGLLASLPPRIVATSTHLPAPRWRHPLPTLGVTTTSVGLVDGDPAESSCLCIPSCGVHTIPVGITGTLS